MNETLIFTATFNEKDNVEQLIDQIKIYSPKSDIFIIDDNSPDGTGELLMSLKKNNKNLIVKIREGKEGLDTAHKQAYEYALKNRYKNLITMDADLSHNPKELIKISNLLENYPFVIGSRYLAGGKNKMSILRFLLSYVGNKFIRFALRLNSTEFTNSYRGFNLQKLKDFHLNKINSKGYSFFMETIFLINKMKFEIKEIPIIFEIRKSGESKIPKIETIRTLFNVIRLYLNK